MGLQKNVVEEWRKDDPEYCIKLEAAVQQAKKAKCFAERAYVSVDLQKIHTVVGCAPSTSYYKSNSADHVAKTSFASEMQSGYPSQSGHKKRWVRHSDIRRRC